MCQAFSCLVDVSAKTTWKFGVDSHTELVSIGVYKDHTADPMKIEFARVEIAPKNRNYLFPDEWVLNVDERIKPLWFTEKHETACRAAHQKWLRQLNKILVHKEIVQPFKLTPPSEITAAHVVLLKNWASIRDSAWNSARDSVRASVRASVSDSVGAFVWNSAWNSVRASVWDSAWDSVGAYIGSFFRILQWKYIKHTKGKYPFQSCVDLWEQGLVPSFDGKTWRLHGGPKAKALFKITAAELRK